jgi:heme exporter protein D
MIDWLAMGGYGEFVWGSYLVTLVAIVGELVLLRSRARRALANARMEVEGGNAN